MQLSRLKYQKKVHSFRSPSDVSHSTLPNHGHADYDIPTDVCRKWFCAVRLYPVRILRSFMAQASTANVIESLPPKLSHICSKPDTKAFYVNITILVFLLAFATINEPTANKPSTGTGTRWQRLIQCSAVPAEHPHPKHVCRQALYAD